MKKFRRKSTFQYVIFGLLVLAMLIIIPACGGGGGGGSSSGSDDTTPAETETADTSNDSGTTDDDSTTLRETYKIVDTNQSSCYDNSGNTVNCSSIKQDGSYSGNQPSYSVSSDGLTVTDNVTGLMWTQSSDTNGDGTVDANDKKFQSEAITYCTDLTLGGYSDWRLPDIKTLYSLILFSGKDASTYQGSDTSTLVPFIDSSFDWAFGDTSADERIIDAQYATTSSYVYTTMDDVATMFGVNFVDGRIKGYPRDLMQFHVRCVRENTSYGINNFNDNGDETISDLATGLMWQKNDSDSTDWENAIAVCEAETTASHSDWRLPNVKELQSILDYTRSPDTTNSAAIDSLFNATSITNEEGETDWGYYWASTTHVDNNDDASSGTYVSFGRALGYFFESILDVHGAGAQRSNYKINLAAGSGVTEVNLASGSFYTKGPQGDILRIDNKVRCVRDID